MSTFQRLAFVLGVLLFAFVNVGTGFAQSAGPGDVLYSWKLATEGICRVLSPDPVGTDLWIADRRVAELQSVVGNSQATAQALQGYRDVLARLASQTDPAARARIAPVLDQEVNVLMGAGVSLPDMEIWTAPGDGVPDGSAPQIPLPEPTVGPGI